MSSYLSMPFTPRTSAVDEGAGTWNDTVRAARPGVEQKYWAVHFRRMTRDDRCTTVRSAVEDVAKLQTPQRIV